MPFWAAWWENTRLPPPETAGTEHPEMTKKYGLKAYSPIAYAYSFSHYDDFGNSRSYGFKRKHLGNDLLGSIGTPIMAVESGIVEVSMEPVRWMAGRDSQFRQKEILLLCAPA